MDLRRHQIDESELLAFIEREPMAADRTDAVRRAIAADAGLRELVEGMRADRSALAGLDNVRAPSNLLELVETRLEREALVGLSRVQAPDSIPVSRVIPERESVIGRIVTRPWARQMAMAAGLLIVAGVGFMVIKANWPAHKPREFARGNHHAEPSTPTNTSNVAAKTAGGANSRNDADLAVGPTRSAAGDSMTAEPTAVQGPTATADASSKDATKAEAHAPAMTLDRAIALAKEGRLVVRLRAADGATAQERLDSLAKRAGSWLKHGPATVGEGVDVTDAVQMAVSASRPQPVSVPNRPTDDAIAGGTPSHSNQRPVMTTPADAVPPPAVNLAAQVYCLTLTPDDDNLRSLLQRLNGGDKDLLAQLQEVASPVTIGAPMTPDAMLWWNRAPVQWDRRLVVPVVVELP